MSNLTPYDRLDDLFNGFFLKPVSVAQDKPALSIKTDIVENDNAYLVKAELPGVAKEDIKVKVEGNVLTISAEVKKESEQKEGDRLVHSERYFGSVSRSFRLESEIDQDKASAKYVDGVLNLELPKLLEKVVNHLRID